MQAFWTILTGILVATSCGLLGCFLILRRMAMVGDAISHAVLPGIVAAFLLTGSRDSAVMLIGAALIGLFTTFLIEFFHQKAQLQTDASIGVTFTWLFALGIILVVFAGNADLDQDCVLYGNINFIFLESFTSFIPNDIIILSAVLLINCTILILGYKELLITTFDSAYAATLGISTAIWHYILMGAVSLTTVASFESVGAILVVSLLVTPPATAYLITSNLKKMIWLTVFIGILISFLGYYSVEWLGGNISTAGAMATIGGILFMLAFLFAPPKGLVLRKFQKGTKHSA